MIAQLAGPAEAANPQLKIAPIGPTDPTRVRREDRQHNENEDIARFPSLLSSTPRADDAGHFFGMACGQSGSFIRISMARAITQPDAATCITSYAYWKAARAPSRLPAPSRFKPIR